MYQFPGARTALDACVMLSSSTTRARRRAKVGGACG
eukprot:CAMPEP_0195575514 /NCGR_PEP_ID=MMETSP0814-20130614/7215_1 /TAXON_ID=97485 /ORGANISM="Prymnesium parvum, Strain Texoma1" /LENGTH=35 /DNA_ID= /DNA_START= /DNA_END= /DNA_ORIENTATION=